MAGPFQFDGGSKADKRISSLPKKYKLTAQDAEDLKNYLNGLREDFDALSETVAILVGSSVGKLKVTKTFADWQPNATGTGTIVIGELPAGAVVLTCKVKPSIAFQNVGQTLSYGTDLKINGTGFGFSTFSAGTETDIFAVSDILGTAFVSTPNTGSGIGEKIPNHVTTTNINAKLDVNSGTIDDLTQGSVDIWIWYLIGL